jgi:hypothetical protein
MANTSRMNRLEELGRVDAEKAYTGKGKRNLRDEKKRIVRELRAFGGPVGKKKQGYKAREDESLGMRTGKESSKKQSMKDRRDESYGKFGKRPNQRINKADGGSTTSKWITKKKKESPKWITKKKKESPKYITKRSRADVKDKARQRSARGYRDGGSVMSRGQGKVMRDRPTFMISMKD